MSDLAPVTSEYDWQRLEKALTDSAKLFTELASKRQSGGAPFPEEIGKLQHKLDALTAMTDTIGQYLEAHALAGSDETSPAGDPVLQTAYRDVAADDDLDGDWDIAPETDPELRL